jgi:ribonucleoside-diphosphate reductase alpha chain
MPRITKITKLAEKQLTVDVEVNGTHSYQLENGWVSHNTVSQLVDCASGIHSRFAKFFIRRVRCDKKDPMAQMMKQTGFPCEDDLYKPEHQWVFSFPMKAPQGAITTGEMSAIDHLELWKMYQQHWCEHKPSCTIYVRENEWMDVGAWVYHNFDAVSGIAFLPYTSHSYKQAPYQEFTEAEYNKMLESMPKSVDWLKMKDFEADDSAVNHKEYACNGNGSCEIVDLTK